MFEFRTPQAVSGSAAGLQEGASCMARDWGHEPGSSEVCLLLLPRKGVKNMHGVLFPHVLLGKGIAWGQATGQWFS